MLVGLRAVSANLTKAWPINATHGVCGWEGVGCSRKGEVRSLNVSARGLVGTLPSEIAVLENLEALNVSANELSGEIPTELAALSLRMLLGGVPTSTSRWCSACRRRSAASSASAPDADEQVDE